MRDICNNESSSNYIPYPCTDNTGYILQKGYNVVVSYNDLFLKF